MRASIANSFFKIGLLNGKIGKSSRSISYKDFEGIFEAIKDLRETSQSIGDNNSLLNFRHRLRER
jgi:hypothetical protein